MGIETTLFGGLTPAPRRGGQLRWLVTNASMSTGLTTSTATTTMVTAMIVKAIAALLQGRCHRFNSGAGTCPGRTTSSGGSDSFITSAFAIPAVTISAAAAAAAAAAGSIGGCFDCAGGSVVFSGP